VVDDVRDMGVLQLMARGAVRVLMTTPSHMVWDPASEGMLTAGCLVLDGLLFPDAMAMLCARIGTEQEQDVQSDVASVERLLRSELHFLLLAVKLCNQLLAGGTKMAAVMRAVSGQRLEDVAGLRDFPDPQNLKAVAGLYQLAMDKVEAQVGGGDVGRLAWWVMGAVGLLRGDGIPVELFEIGGEVEASCPPLQGLSKAAEGIMQALDGAGLVEWDVAQRVVRCHERVQQAACLLGAMEERPVLGKLMGCLAAAMDRFMDRWDERGLLNGLCRQAERVVELCDGAGVNVSGNCADRCGLDHMSDVLSELSAALEHLERGLRIERKALGEEHLDTTTSRNNIGLAYDCMGQHERALEHLERGLRICVKVLGEEHPRQHRACVREHGEARTGP
jgi:hypothetical protein